jgi:polysaccharide deacetylase 2 family uncharacterized protein YibQ
MKHLGTLFWLVLLGGSLACVFAGFSSARGFHTETLAGLHVATKTKTPAAVTPRTLERQLVGAHSFVVDDDDPPPIDDVVVKRSGDWAPPLEQTAVASHPRLALIVTDLGHALPLDSKFAALPVALTLAVDPEGGDAAEFVRALGDRRVLMTVSNAVFSNPSNQALEQLAARYAALHAEGALSPLSGSIDGSQALRVVSQLPGSSIVIDGMAEGTPTVYRYARGRGLPGATRDIVIDARDGVRYAAFMLREAAGLALHTGVAVAVARSRPDTLKAIVAALPMFDRDGIEIVPIDVLAARTVTQR